MVGVHKGQHLENINILLRGMHDNADMINEEDRFKFVDDLTALEIINLLCIQISAYGIRSHVPSDIPVHNDYIKRELLQSQKKISLLEFVINKPGI